MGQSRASLFESFTLASGAVVKNRIFKSAMSDSLGNGEGQPTDVQHRLYQTWAEGGVGGSIIGEVQISPDYPEKPGNLVLDENADRHRFEALADAGHRSGALLWPQLGHAGAMAYPPVSQPKGPSALDLPGLKCAALTAQEITMLPEAFAASAALAKSFGFSGVQIHAAHGFLLNQFLSPLFNHRDDAYGGTLRNRMRLLLEVLEAVRSAAGPDFTIALKLNSSDMLLGGFQEEEALKVIAALPASSVDLIDISGGTYFPGAVSASDRVKSGAYFAAFSGAARQITTVPLMLTGGIKTFSEAERIIASGVADFVGLARALVIDPVLPRHWESQKNLAPEFPRFAETPEGGVTAWYTMALSDIAAGNSLPAARDIHTALKQYEDRDAARAAIWRAAFSTK